MKWSWKIATISGVDVYIHATFVLLIAFIAFTQISAGASVGTALAGIFLILLLFLCVLLHEFGHAMAARRYGIKTRDITLYPIGGVARLERMPEDPRQEIVVALAGPAVNVAIAAFLLVTAGAAVFAQGPLPGPALISNLFWANVFLGLFNLIPAFPMDGGRVLRAALAMKMPYVSATQIAANVGQGMALLFGFIGLIWNPFLIFIALFVYLGASQEAAFVQMRSSFSGIPVRQAMITSYRVLSPFDRLSTAVDHLLTGSQQDFPVVDGDTPVGVLSRSDLVVSLRSEGPDTSVGDVMRPCPWTVDGSEMLDGVFQKMQAEGVTILPVVHAGRMVGLLTTENIGEFVMVQAALRGRAAGKVSPA